MPYVDDCEKSVCIEEFITDFGRYKEIVQKHACAYFKAKESDVEVVYHAKLKEVTYFIEVNNVLVGLNVKLLKVYNKNAIEKDCYYLILEDLSRAKEKQYHAKLLKGNKLTEDTFSESIRTSFGVFTQKVLILEKFVNNLSAYVKKEVLKHNEFLTVVESDPYTDKYLEKTESLSVYRSITIEAKNKDEHFTISTELNSLKEIILRIYQVQFDSKYNIFTKEIKKSHVYPGKNIEKLNKWSESVVSGCINSVLYNCYSF